MTQERRSEASDRADDRDRGGLAPEISEMADRLVEAAAALAHGAEAHRSARRTALVEDMVRSSLKVLEDGSDLGQVKVMERV